MAFRAKDWKHHICTKNMNPRPLRQIKPQPQEDRIKILLCCKAWPLESSSTDASTLDAFFMGFFLAHFQHWCFFSSLMNDKWEGGLWVLRVAAFLFFLAPLPIVLVLNELRKSVGRGRVPRDSQAWQTQTRRQRIPVEFKNVKGTRQRQWDSEKPHGIYSDSVFFFFSLSPNLKQCGWDLCPGCLWESNSKTFQHATTLETYRCACSLCCCYTLVIWSAIPQPNSLKISCNAYAPTSSEGTIQQAKGDMKQSLWRSPQDRISASLWALRSVSDHFLWVNCFLDFIHSFIYCTVIVHVTSVPYFDRFVSIYINKHHYYYY